MKGPVGAGEVWQLRKSRVARVVAVLTLEPVRDGDGDWLCLVLDDSWRGSRPGVRLDGRAPGEQARFRLDASAGWERVS